MQIKQFRKSFVEVDNPTLFDLILAANYLNISSLLDITCQAVAEQIKGKTPEQIRERFNIEVRHSTARQALCIASWRAQGWQWMHPARPSILPSTIALHVAQDPAAYAMLQGTLLVSALPISALRRPHGRRPVGMHPEDALRVQNDFTPEEEEQVRRENQWAFD